jgi:hypothetical protein
MIKTILTFRAINTAWYIFLDADVKPHNIVDMVSCWTEPLSRSKLEWFRCHQKKMELFHKFEEVKALPKLFTEDVVFHSERLVARPSLQNDQY